MITIIGDLSFVYVRNMRKIDDGQTKISSKIFTPKDRDSDMNDKIYSKIMFHANHIGVYLVLLADLEIDDIMNHSKIIITPFSMFMDSKTILQQNNEKSKINLKTLIEIVVESAISKMSIREINDVIKILRYQNTLWKKIINYNPEKALYRTITDKKFNNELFEKNYDIQLQGLYFVYLFNG